MTECNDASLSCLVFQNGVGDLSLDDEPHSLVVGFKHGPYNGSGQASLTYSGLYIDDQKIHMLEHLL